MKHTFYINKVKGRCYLYFALREKNRRAIVSTGIVVPDGSFVPEAQNFIRCSANSEYIKQLERMKDAAVKVVDRANLLRMPLDETRIAFMEAVGIGPAKAIPEAETPDFMEKFDEWVNTPTTRRRNNIHHRQSLNLFRQFIGKRKVSFDDITVSLSERWIEWMNARELAPNTRGGHMKVLKAFMNAAYIEGLHSNTAYRRFRKEREQTDAIYLTSEEIRMIADAPCRGMEEKARDMFILGCYTGQRYSDCAAIRPDDIDGDYLHIIQQKTKARVIIPVHPKVKAILEKWNGAPSISEQKENQAIKQLCRSLGINARIALRRSGKVEYYEKWELVTTHTARRSCITNLHLSGENLTDIMRISGHTSQSTLNVYLKMTAEDTARKLRGSRFFNE